ncbi:MAG: hypothetical protein IPJ74_03190 [Saprospiraceae bacterium]|nr:hypothetical protein [Saprospiraceae bacterium]
MGNATNLFEGFQSVSKSEWLAKIEKDLKGKPLADLQFQLEEDITLEPFYHPEDFNEFYKPLAGETSWQIGEYIEASNVKTANEQALEALNGGANALLFELRHELSEDELSQLLAGIELEYIQTNFGQYFPDKNPALLLERFYNFIKSSGKNPKNIDGSLDFDAILDWSNPPFDDLAKAVQFVIKKCPIFESWKWMRVACTLA